MSASAVCSGLHQQKGALLPRYLREWRCRGKQQQQQQQQQQQRKSSKSSQQQSKGKQPLSSSQSPCSEGEDPVSRAVLTDMVIEAMERAWMGDPTAVLGIKPSSSTLRPSTLSPSKRASEGGAHAPTPRPSFSSTSKEQARGACPWPPSRTSSTSPSVTPTPTEPTPIPFSPSVHCPIPAKPIPAANTVHQCSDQEVAAKQPLRGANGATPLNARGAARPAPSDFASVFFSPLPFSYLNAAQSNSTEQLLAQSDSPDVTLRAGRLAVSFICGHIS
ncbi:hypothetical protein DUNSADRAFT_2703 [Dunaliella salina]|uniref:Encoded protein n=1 Tax=Dunaliella salina TaxID=3046 RepID=A0ABQ7H8B0_DUNSA|nr:hypothetical protein DUNSADRAFT_2703 [Dunaliella salina]|eukprot:KAF5843090.1 hypothetical protein DUNSADRAFT_2703 [Dunaliella salina]